MLFFISSSLLLTCALHAGPTAESLVTDLYHGGQYVKTNETTLEDLSFLYDAFLLDAYGVFWGSSEVGVLPGAAAAMEYLVSQGKHVGILSNSTQLAVKEKEKFKKHGLYEGVHYHFVLTSGDVAKELLLAGSLPFPTPRSTYWLFGSPHPRFGSHLQIFEGTEYRETKNLEEADFIYVSIPHIEGIDQENPEVFRKMVQAVGREYPVLCVNPDRFALEGSPPRPVVRQGSIAQMFAEQQAPIYLMGKPSKLIYEAALKRFPQDILKEKIVMIGDTPETDIRGAHGAGLDAVLVTKTGVMACCLEKEGILPVIGRLSLDDKPDFFIERLGLCPFHLDGTKKGFN
jgi:HAD superfamily hydrolase (TIGR01459 family)